MIKQKVKSRIKIKKSIQRKIKGTAEKPRLAVYRSLKGIYVQFIDDDSNRTLLSVSTLSKQVKEKLNDVKGKVSVSKIVGKVAAELALSKGINKGVFDRGGFRYHGRVKALADGLREGGLKI